MKLNIKRLGMMALLGLFLPLAAHADLPGRHPYYLHALSDLRGARWLLEHRPGDPAVSGQEDVAITEIERAIGEIKHASIDDGKNLDDHPPIDYPHDHPGRLHKAIDLLHKVHNDVAREEDDPQTHGLKDRALMHIDEATHAAERALRDAR
ncbi:MAG: hypothetical protein WA777_16140 [Rhodanobacter sp.]